MDAREFHRAATAPLPDLPAPVSEPLAAGEREELAANLETALAARLLPSPRHAELQNRLTAAWQWSQKERPDSRTVLAVDGPFAVGKSGAVIDWAHRVHRAQLGDRVGQPRPRWSPSPDIQADLVPVLLLSLSGRQNAVGIWRMILAALGHGYQGSADDLEIRGGRALLTHGVRVLVIDDVHMLNTRLIMGRATVDGVKTLNDSLSRTGGTLVVVGANIADGDLLSDPQIGGRAQVFQLRPYTIYSKADIAEWQRLIKGVESVVAPYLPPEEHCLLGHARMLWQRSQGHVRDLSKLVVHAVANSIRDGGGPVSVEHIAAVSLTKRAVDHEKAQNPVQIARTTAGSGRNRRPVAPRTQAGNDTGTPHAP